MSETDATPQPQTAVTVANPGASVADLMPPELRLAVEQVVQSGLYGKVTRWEAATRIAAGVELGFSAMSAMSGTYIVSGKLVMSYPLLGALIQCSKRFRYSVLEQSAKRAAVLFEERTEEDVEMPDGTWRTVRKWRPLGTSEFTIEEAKAAGLLGKPGPWQQYPKIMLFARALSAGVRIYTPSLTKQPVYVPGELDSESVSVQTANDSHPKRVAARAKAEVVEAIIESSDAVPRDVALRETVADVIGANG